MPAPFLQRIVLKNTDVYEYNKPFPDAPPDFDPALELMVGPIFFCKELAESYPQLDENGNIKRDKNQQPLRETAIDTEGAHYEVWCVPKKLFVDFFGQIASLALGGTFQIDQQKLESAMQSGVIVRRRIYVDSVAYADDLWQTRDAFREIVRSFADAADKVIPGLDDDDEEDVEEEAEEEPQQRPTGEATLQPDGNGSQVLPPATS